MRSARFFVAVSLAYALGASLTACGAEDDDGGGETPDLGTCDRTSSAFQCIEMHDPTAIDLANQEDGCDDAGGAWSNDPCPTEALVGCCDYVIRDQSGGVGAVFRECFYENYAGDAVAGCDSVDGTWTPAS